MARFFKKVTLSKVVTQLAEDRGSNPIIIIFMEHLLKRLKKQKEAIDCTLFQKLYIT